ncbi:MAG: hypothetical protein JKX75_03500 [Gammaproteobacteria bacterium]|nr:hypothetical protein [Gammaproteobacteria bacterium]
MRKLPVQKRPARKLLGAIVAAALLIPNLGFTLGLGEIEVNSALNQKLNADIELLSASPEDTETIIIKLASRKQFSRAGLDRPYSLNDLRFKSEIVDGVPYIKVSSSSPIREPFLNFLVEIDWPNGHLLREYTVLLDPPVFMTQSASATSNVVESAPTNTDFRPNASNSNNVATPAVTPGASLSSRPTVVTQAPVSQPVPVQAAQVQTKWVPAPVLQQQSIINQPAGSYKIKAGDTAWSLADAMRPDQSVTVPQMMVAMLRSNPDSFINENVNGLKRGYILRVPDYNQITSISNADALALVKEQAALWRQYQQSQSGGQPVSAMKDDGQKTAGSGADDNAKAEDDAYLEIVSAGSGSSSVSGKDPTQMNAKELRAELAFARERVETELVEKEALQQRVATLQQHVEKMKGMLSIEDTELAQVQSLGMPDDKDMADDADTSAENSQLDATDTEASEAMSTDAAIEAEQDVTDADMEAEGQLDAENTDKEALFVDDSVADAAVVDEDASTQNKAAKEKDENTATKPELDRLITDKEPDGLLTQFMSNPMQFAAAGGFLLLLAALIGYIVKRRKTTKQETTPAVVNTVDDMESIADDIAEEVEDAEELTTIVSDEDNIVEDDFDSEATMILDSADDTIITEAESESEEESRDDVIAEADVYLAYGIYQQSEDLLTQAIKDNPDRDDYRVKLAETHYASKNAAAFVSVAGDIQTRVSDDSSTWKKVVGMGQDLCADNPMFQGSMVGVDEVGIASTPETPEMDFDLGSDGDETELSDLDLTLDDEVESDSNDILEPVEELEFDLSDAGAVEELTDLEDEFALDIDASELDIEIKDEADDEEESLELTGVDIGLDEILDAEDTEIIEDIGDIDLDFGLDDEVADLSADTEEEIVLDISADIAEDSESEIVLDLDADIEAGIGLDLDDEEISLDLTEEAAAFDMGLDDDDAAETETVETEVESELDEVEEIKETEVASLEEDDEDDFDLSNLDDVDEISTKLDLARAYLDMGDHEGTKEILAEVLADGNDEQKQEANELMANMD